MTRILLRLTAIAGLVVVALPAAWSQQKADQAAPPNQTTPNRNASLFDPYGLHQTPWYSGNEVRRQLGLTEDQFNLLNRNYNRFWTRYNTGLNGIQSDLDAQERLRRHQALSGKFYEDFASANNDIFQDPAARQRFQELNWQYRGYGAFADPAVQQKLNLTESQREQFDNYNRDWVNQMNKWSQDYASQRDATMKAFNESRARTQEQIQSTLRPEQWETWNRMSGKPYEFPADSYFSPTNPTPSNSTQNLNTNPGNTGAESPGGKSGNN